MRVLRVTGLTGIGTDPVMALTSFSLRVWREPETTFSVLVPISWKLNSPSLIMCWMVRPVEPEPQAMYLKC